MAFRKYGRAMGRADIEPKVWAVTGSYTLRLYCLHDNHTVDRQASEQNPETYGDVPILPYLLAGESRADALSDARKQGWYISRDEQRVLCPYHAKQVPR